MSRPVLPASHVQPNTSPRARLKPWQAYLFAILMTALTAGLWLSLEPSLRGRPTLVLFTLPIMLSAYAGGARGGLLATGLSCLIAGYFLPSQRYTWQMASTGQLDRQLLLALAGVVISVSIEGLYRARRRADITGREQHQAKEHAAQSEQRLRGLIDGLGPTMFVGLLTPQGILIEINQAPLTAAGLTAADVLGQPFVDTPWWATSPAVQQQLRDAIERGASGLASRYDVRTLGVANEIIDIDFSLQPLRDESGRVVFLVPSAIVITERKQIENALREVNRKFHQLADHITDAFWIRSPDMREVEYISPAFERIWGRSVESLYAAPNQWAEWILPEDRERVLDAFAALVTQGTPLDVEYRVVRPDHDIRWVRARGFPVRDAADRLIRQTGIVSDITERKRVETALQESEGRYRALVDWSPEAIAVHRDGRVLFVNPAAIEMMGATCAGDLVGTAVSNLVHPDSHQLFLVRDTDNAGRTGSVPLMEGRLVTLDGTLIDVEVQATPIVYEGARAMYTSVRDITERKRAAESLQTSMEEFRSLAEAMPQMVWITRPDGWTVYFNHQWMDYTGLTLGESLGHGWNTPFHPDDQERAWNAWQVATATIGTYSIESRLRRADGAYRWWLVRGVPILDASGEIRKWFGTCTDIHDLKLAELEVTRANRALKMLSSCNEALTRAGREAALLDDICRIVVEIGGYRMAWVGYTQEDFWPSITPMAHGGIESAYLSEMAFGGSVNGEVNEGPGGRALRTAQAVVCEDVLSDPTLAHWAMAARQGGYRGVIALPLRDTTHIFGLLALYSADVQSVSTEELTLLQDLADDLAFGIGHLRAQIERNHLATQVREQATLLDIAHDAIYVRDLDGYITYWNKGAEQAYGWTAEAALGQRALELLCRQPSEYQQAETALLLNGTWQGEMSRRTHADRDITMAVRWTLVRDDNGIPKSILAIDTDITEKKTLESQFLRAQRMEGIGTLASGISHDLNNVLAPIVMSIETLRDMVRDQDALTVLAALQSSAQRGTALVTQVLSFARGVEGQHVVVDLLDVIGDLLGVMRDTFPKSIDVRFTPERDLWTITGDPTQMHQVLLNLCVNARDAMPGGGTLAISMNNVVLSAADTGMAGSAQPGSYVRVKVEDTGTGVPMEVRDRVFEPFFTTKVAGKGTGLGLSTTLAIVKSHGGVIALDSAAGKGAAFSVYLPANTAFRAADTARATEAGTPRGRGELVLVVDDEEAIRIVAQQTLERFGYRVMVASNGAEAIEAYAGHRHDISVVLTDMAMPIVDGVALIATLRSMNPDVRIIGSSGLMSAVDASSALGADLQYFLPKPYTAGVMLRVLHTALGAQPNAE